jgi:hypothetical protein
MFERQLGLLMDDDLPVLLTTVNEPGVTPPSGWLQTVAVVANSGCHVICAPTSADGGQPWFLRVPSRSLHPFFCQNSGKVEFPKAGVSRQFAIQAYTARASVQFGADEIANFDGIEIRFSMITDFDDPNTLDETVCGYYFLPIVRLVSGSDSAFESAHAELTSAAGFAECLSTQTRSIRKRFEQLRGWRFTDYFEEWLECQNADPMLTPQARVENYYGDMAIDCVVGGGAAGTLCGYVSDHNGANKLAQQYAIDECIRARQAEYDADLAVLQS